MAFTLYHRYRRDVESVPRRSLESPDAPLTHDNLVVPMRHDVLRGHEQLGYRCRESALEENRPLHVSELCEQSKVLHIARANLEHVRMLGDEIHMSRIEHFSHNRNSNLASNLREHSQRIGTQALKAVRRAPRLERSASQHRSSGIFYGDCGL